MKTTATKNVSAIFDGNKLIFTLKKIFDAKPSGKFPQMICTFKEDQAKAKEEAGKTIAGMDAPEAAKAALMDDLGFSLEEICEQLGGRTERSRYKSAIEKYKEKPRLLKKAIQKYDWDNHYEDATKTEYEELKEMCSKNPLDVSEGEGGQSDTELSSEVGGEMTGSEGLGSNENRFEKGIKAKFEKDF